MVTVYTKDNCPACNITEMLLNRNEIPYTAINMSENPEAVEAIKEMGYLQAPVVVFGEASWSGLQPDRIKELSTTLVA